ncbi:MAG: hypothetical protein KC422_05335 [Trueperaceae bacterium]|nr:hypothetical protein [Trueperaceae bacterium]
MKKIVFLLSLFGLTILLTACPNPSVPTGNESEEVIIPETTKVMNEETRQLLSDYNPDTGYLRFAQSTPQLESLNSGDIIASEPGSVAPEGYLRRIKTLRQEGGALILETEQASLDQAVAQGSLSVERALKPEDIVATKALLKGVSIQLIEAEPSKNLSGQALETQALNFKVDFNQVLLDADGNNNTTADQLKLNGSFAFSPKVIFDIDIKFLFRLQKLKLGMGFTEEVNLELSGFAGGTLTKEIAVAQFYTAPLTFFIGPVPIVLTPKVDINIGVDGQIGAEISVGLDQSLDVTIGAEWRRGQGWQNISGVDSNADYYVDAFALSMVARAYAGAEASILLYGLAGPYLYGRAFAEIDVGVPRDPLWILSAGLEAGVGFEVEILSFTLVDWHKDVLNVKKEIGRAANGKPSIEITAPSGNSFDMNKLIDFEAEASDPEDGNCFLNDKCTVSWSSSQDGNLGTGDFISHSFATGGVRTITATVTDSKGQSSSDSMTVTVVNTPPTVFISPPSNQPLLNNVTYLLQGGATDANEGDGLSGPGTLVCNNPGSYAWTVQGSDEIIGSSTGCQVKVRFHNANSSRDVTLSATDPQGASSSKTISISIGAAPANPAPEIQDAKVLLKGSNQEVHAGEFHTLGSLLVLSASATDPEGDPISYSWSASFNGNPFQDIGTGASLEFDPRDIPDTGGELTISLSISDGTTTIPGVYSLTFKWFLPVG